MTRNPGSSNPELLSLIFSILSEEVPQGFAGRKQSHVVYYQECFIPKPSVIPCDFIYPDLK